MITVIRKQIKSNFIKYLLWFFIVLFGIVFIVPDIGNRSNKTEWLVRVNGQDIDQISFYRSVAKQEANIRVIREQYGAYADMFMQMLGLSGDPKKLAFEELVRESLVDEVAVGIPLHIHEDYVDQKFNDPIFIQQSGLYNLLPLGLFTPQGIDEQSLRMYLSRINMNFNQFEEQVEKALARYICLEIAGLANFTPNYIFKRAIRAELAKRKYAIISLNLDTIKKELRKDPINEGELKSFFDKQNKLSKQYWVPEKRAGLIWRFDPELYGINISEDAIQSDYDKNKVRKYTSSPAQVQIRRILFKISDTEPKEIMYQRAQSLRNELAQNPDLFAQKAKELSEDADSSDQGGLLPYFAKGDRNPVIEKKSFLLKDGEISDVFETTDGFEIVQRVSAKQKEYTPLTSVKDDIRKALLQQAFAKEFSKDLKRILDPSGIDEKALATFVKEKNSKESAISLTAKDNSRKMQTLFKLKDGEAGFFVEGDAGYIVLLNKVKKRYLPSIDTIRDAVEQDFIEYRAFEGLSNRLKEIKSELLLNENEKAIAKKFGALIQETAFLTKDDQDAVKGLQEQGVPVDHMLQIENKGAAVSQVSDNKGYIFKVLEIQEPDKEVLEDKKAVIENRAQNERKGLFVQGFVASLSRNATIETNKPVFTLNESQAI